MNAIGTVFRFIWRGIDFLRKVMHLIVLLVFFITFFALVKPNIPFVPQQAALVLAPQGTLVEQLSGDPLGRAIAEAYGRGRAETLLRDLIDSIEAAKTDDRIKVLVLDLSGMAGGGVAKLEELAAAIRDFRTSGKKVIALGEFYDQSQYYLAANADEINLDPQGMVLIEGFGYYRTFLKGLIDKLAVDVNVFRAGKFKSYTDQFSRADMSEQEREESLAWLNALWGQYQAGVTKARSLEPQAIATYISDMAPGAVTAPGPTSAATKTPAGAVERASPTPVPTHRGDLATFALERGLVTALKSRREVEDQLKGIVGEDRSKHSYQGIAHWDYLANVRSTQGLHMSGDRIGVVVASGEILDGLQPPGTIGSDSAVLLLRKALDDKSVKAVVLRIDSPGGSMLASEVIRREIDALKQAGKPVIASMSGTAASGGYYIAMDADEIWANPGTITGSIGVFTVFPTFQRTLEKFGVTVDGVGTTPLADALRVDRTLQEAPKQVLQLSVEHAYSVFVNGVATARKKSYEEIDAIAQGRVWAGVDAAQNGLVDKLGSFKDALGAAAKRANLGDDYRIEYLEPPLGWREALARQTHVLAARATHALVPQDRFLADARQLLSPVENELARFARFRDPMNSYYYCFCSVN
jgi:protease-4